MKRSHNFSSHVVGHQLVFIGFSILVVLLFLLWAIFIGNVYDFIMALVVAILLGVPNLFFAKFSEVSIDGETFMIKRLFKPIRTVPLISFDKVLRMDTILFIPSAGYFVLLLKTGERICFVAKASENPAYIFQDKEKLAQKITAEIEDYINKSE